MSSFGPKIFIFKNTNKKKFKPKLENCLSTEGRTKNSTRHKSKYDSERAISKIDINNGINDVINKIKFGKAIDRYLYIKKKIYLNELRNQNDKKEFKFEKLNFIFDKFTRNKKNKIKNGIVHQMNNAHKLNVNTTFEKIWNKLGTKSYEKFKEEFNFTQDKNGIILRKIKNDQKNLSTKMDINIKKIKKIFGDEIIERLKKNLELKKEEETIFSVRNNINLKNYKSVKNIKVIKFKRSFSNKTVNRSNNSKKTLLLKNSDTFYKKYHDPKKEEEARKIIKWIRKANTNEKNKVSFSDLSEKNQLKKKFKFSSFNQRYSRNINNSNFNLESQRQNSKITKEFKHFIKNDSEKKQTSLVNSILPIKKRKIQRSSMMNYLTIKLSKNNIKTKSNKAITKRNKEFKERLIKNVELIFNDEDNDY